MNIGFDLDETLVYGDIIREASILTGHGDKWSNRNLTSYDLAGIPEDVKKKAIELFSNAEYSVYKKKLLPGIAYFINQITMKNHSIRIITSRPAHLYEPTKAMLQRDGINLIRIELRFPNQSTVMKLNEHRPKKADALKHLDMYFDDSIEYCQEALDNGVKQVFLISNKYTPWNHMECDPRIRKIKSVIHIEPWEIY